MLRLDGVRKGRKSGSYKGYRAPARESTHAARQSRPAPAAARSAAASANRRVSRSRATKSTRTAAPYQSPSTSNRCASSPTSGSPKVGRGPRFTIPPQGPPGVCTRTAYTPSGGSSLRAGSGARFSVRKPIRRPRPVARDHAPRHGIGATEPVGRARQLPARHGPADRRRRHRAVLIERHRAHDLDPESALGAESPDHLGAALPSAPEAVVVADEQLPHPVPIAKHELHELRRVVARQRRRERKHHHVIEPELAPAAPASRRRG